MEMDYIKRVQLSEIVEVVTKGTTPTTLGYEFQDEGVNFLKIECFNENGGFIESKVAHISEECHKKMKRSQLKNGDILFSIAGAIGRVAIVTEEMLPANINQALAIIRISDEQVYLPYIKLILTSPIVIEQFERKKQGVAQLNLSLKDINEISIPLPSKDKQIELAELFDKVVGAISKRNKELSALDDLTKARFVEMFGDIKTNEYGWEKCTFKDVSKKITDGEHGTVPRVDEGEGYLYFMARNITKEGEIDLSETSFVPREIHEKIYKRCNPEKDDLLLVCVGATIGKCTLVSEIMGEFSMARSVALIKPNKEMVTSNFLINLLRSEAIQNDIEHCSHAAAQAGLYTNMINSLEAFVPPMDLQIEFDTFCEQVYKSKVKVQKALDETQKLFDSLMQQYFG